MSKARVNEEWVSGFTAETPVLMANGKVKPISKITEGEEIASFDPVTGKYTKSRVLNTWSDIFQDVLEVDTGDKQMIVAASQLFYTPSKEFKSALDAKQIMTDDGFAKDITVRKYKGGKIKLFDITVDKTHAFIADGIMVHNKGGGSGKKKKPAPPPDPVVTAGRVGQPLTVGVNGNTITVNPPPNAAASIAVSYTGGVTTGYHAVPGTYYNYTYQPPVVTVNPVPAGTINLLDSAEAQRSATCNGLGNIPNRPSNSVSNGYAAELALVRANIEQARASDPFRFVSTREKGAVSRDVEYANLIADVKELERFVKKQNQISNKNRTFINTKCDEIGRGIGSVRNQLANTARPEPGIPGTPCPPAPAPQPTNPRIYSDSPDYAYYNSVGTNNVGCKSYVKQVPGQVRSAICYAGPGAVACYSSNELWYKHFDPNNGKFYYDQRTNNCV